VWGPLESLYKQGKDRIQDWSEGTPAEVAQHKTNELILPEGRRR